ncbi:hypothetical protein [Streptomyces orinoci]|uniref:DUF7848 domain-containing protein n=1 Tax=Streptomyces orinoci TaxID=67339 RepID=A0ABV3K9A2_STRON|nr:hypothetical protein [Streptomyces orinoci]
MTEHPTAPLNHLTSALVKIMGVPEVTHELECLTCSARSGQNKELEPTRGWARRHSAGIPSHTTYREIVHRYWQASLLK